MSTHTHDHLLRPDRAVLAVLTLSAGILSCSPKATGPEKEAPQIQRLVFSDIQNAGPGSLEDNKMLFEVDQVLPSQNVATFLAPTAIEHVFADFAANSGQRSVLFVADTLNNAIRRVELDNGMTSTFAGSQTEGYADGPADQALFRRPAGLAASSKLVYRGSHDSYSVADTFGALFVADTGNHVIRRVDFSTRMVTTIAGQPARPGLDDGGEGTSFNALTVRFNQPTGMVFVAGENVLYVADTGNSKIRKLTLSADGQTVVNVDTVSVSPGSWLKRPTALAIDKNTSNGTVHLYIADPGTHSVQRMRVPTGGLDSPIGLTNKYGHADAASFPTVARLAAPAGLAIVPDSTGRKALYISDAASHTVRRYWIDAPPPGKQRVETPWGDPWKPGRTEGSGTGAQFDSPAGMVAVAERYPRSAGGGGIDLVIVDQGNHTLRRIANPGSTTTPNASVFVGDAIKPGFSDGWPARRSIGIPSGLACRNGRLYVNGNGTHELNPANGGARTLSPLNVGHSIAATSTFVFLGTQYGLASIDLLTLERRTNGNPSFSASFAQVFGAGEHLAFGTFGSDNDNDTAELTGWQGDFSGGLLSATAQVDNDTRGAVSEGFVFFQKAPEFKLYKTPVETLAGIEQVADNSAHLPEKFAISGNHLFVAEGTSITRQAFPSNPAEPIGDPDPSFTLNQFDNLNGSICVDGNMMFVGDNSGRLHQINLATRQVQEIVPNFSIAP